MKRALLVAVVLSAVLHALVAAQQVGPNVNVLAGTAERTGDAFLQRQNEAVVAASTRNPDHLIVAMNDYRTVDFVDTTIEETNNGIIAKLLGLKGKAKEDAERVRANVPAEAWIGLAFSTNRGRTWYTGLLPGYPQDPTAVGQSSPVYGDTAGSDPVLVTGQNGRVYLIALTFDRGGVSRITSTRYTDRNNVEGGEAFYYDFTKQIDRGSVASKGRFADKPSAAAFAAASSSVFSTSGVSTKKRHVVVVPGCERVYAAYTVFEGTDANGNFRNSVYVATTASCGESWTPPAKVSGPFDFAGTNYPGTRNQGTATAVDPDTGHVYVAWRTYEPNGMVYVKSTDGGLTFSAPRPITASPIHAYDQPLYTVNDGVNATTFRSNAYPSILVYDGKLVAAWQERVDLATGLPTANGVPRIVMTVGTAAADGTVTWNARRAADSTDPGAPAPNHRCENAIPEGQTSATVVCRPSGAQVQPFLTARNGQVAIAYYESRHQAADPLIPGDAGAPGGLVQLATGTFISGIERQIDVRTAIIDPITWATTSSFQVSRYPIDPRTGRIAEHANPAHPKLKKKVNYGNYPMFRGGIAAFIGDYLHLIPIRPDGGNPGFSAVFTSNELVIPPADLDFTKYVKPQQGLDPNTVCNAGSRNSTIMTAEVGTGLVIGSPGTFKQLVDGSGQAVQRAFAVYLENHTPGFRAFRLSFTNVAAGVTASFDQFAVQGTTDVEVLANSSVTRTVFLSGTNATGSVVVNASEIQMNGGAQSLGLTAALTLNADATNPLVGGAGGNPGLATTEVHTPQLSTPQLGTPQLGTPQIGTPQLGTPQLGTPQLGTPQLGTPQISTPQLGTPQLGTPGPGDYPITDITLQVTNEGNTASAYNSLISLANAPHLQTSGHTFQVIVYRVHQAATVNGCAIGRSQQDQVIYMTPQLGTPQLGTPQLGTPQIGTPQLGTPQLGTPQLGTPQLGTPQLGTPQLATASFTIAPADPDPTHHDGTEHQHIQRDVVMLTVRVTHPDHELSNFTQYHPNVVSEFGNALAIAVEAQAADTGEAEPEGTFYGPDINLVAAPIASPTQVVPGDTVTLTKFVVGNDGNKAANSQTGSFTHGFYLSNDAAFDATDVLLASKTNVNADLPAPVPPATSTDYEFGASTPVTIPVGTTAGSKYVLLVLDNQDRVAEVDEGNNVFAIPITVYPPLNIVTTSPLTAATFDTPYNVPIQGFGGIAPYTWTTASAVLPAGVTFTSGTPNASLAGTPGAVGSFGFIATLQDSAGHTISRTFSFEVLTPAGAALEFSIQPGGGPAGKRIAGPATVRAYYTRPDTTQVNIPGVSVSVALGSNPTTATLGGTATGVTGPLGTAPFPLLYIDKTGTATPGSAAVGSYTLAATSPTATSATSNAFNIVAKRLLLYGEAFVESEPGGTTAPYTPNERTIAEALGYVVDILSESTTPKWSGLTTAQFAGYNAIVIPDPNHNHNPLGGGDLAVAENSRQTWSAATTGPKMIIGTDPIYHRAFAGAEILMRNGINFAASAPETGLFVALSTHYAGATTNAGVTALDQFGGFSVTALESSVAEIVTANGGHPGLANLTNALLSGWGSSVHEYFTVWPATWKVLAVEATDPNAFRPYIIVDR